MRQIGHLIRARLTGLAGRLAALALASVLGILAAGPAAAQTYPVKPGDVLKIEVLEDTSLNRNVLVAPDGRITLPLAGTVRVGGRSVDDIGAELKSRLASNFAAPPNVFVSVDRVAVPKEGAAITGPVVGIYVLGEVANPGRREVARGTTLLQMFAEMGGFSKFAATRRIQLRRVDAQGLEQVYTIDYHALERGAALRGIPTMAEGDVIIVPQRRLFE